MTVLLALISASLFAADIQPSGKFEVHEWGTFTSVAGPDGTAVDWQPFGGPTDLPCFVHRFQVGFKANLAGKVRMETPVIYFYTLQPMTASVHVAFPNGYITEWYPKANQVAYHRGSGSVFDYPDPPFNDAHTRPPRTGEPESIEWPQIKIEPLAEPKYPFQFESSHYYAARSTDSAPLKVGDEKEKFLFYRGVGEFQPPIAVQVTGDQVRVRNLGHEELPAAILFENHDGKIRYQVHGALKNDVAMELPKSAGDLAALKLDLEKILSAQGLFPREAHAMVETWRDSWFEEGARVFYVLPSTALESILPLQIEPRPDRMARVFVGRVEVFTPEVRNIVTTAIASWDQETLEKYGRFLQPLTRDLPPNQMVQKIYQKYLTLDNGCGKAW
jgi:hypothetical protein